MFSLNLFIQTIYYTINRCNRAEERKGKLVAFGGKDYSKEKLVAELGSANLMNIIGIETDKSFCNSATYI